MKKQLSIALLFTLQVSTAYPWDIKAVNDYYINENFQSLLSSGLQEECDFEESLPVHLIMDSETLKSRLEGPYSSLDWYQILLLNDVYNIDRSVLVIQNIKLCGLRHWLPTVFANLTAIANVDLVERSSNSTQFYSSFPATLSNDNRVKLIFRGDNSRYPALYVKTVLIALNNLAIYLHEQSQAYALYGAGCTRTTPYSACEDALYETFTYLNNTKMEDLSGSHPFLLRTEDISHLFADNSEFNFKHNDTDASAETAALYLHWTYTVRITNSTIVNYGNRGRAIFWEGIAKIYPDNFIENTIIDSDYKNASIIGIYLTGYYITRDSSPFIYSYLPYFRNIIFKQGITTGFYFQDNSFYLRSTGSNGNQFNSNGTHCYQVPNGTISFIDGTICTNAVSPTGSPTTDISD